jgi:hypothetical protein
MTIRARVRSRYALFCVYVLGCESAILHNG